MVTAGMMANLKRRQQCYQNKKFAITGQGDTALTRRNELVGLREKAPDDACRMNNSLIIPPKVV
jgi:hypothetical protein